MPSSPTKQFPGYITRHYSLSQDSFRNHQPIESIKGDLGSFLPTAQWAHVDTAKGRFDFLSLHNSQIEFPAVQFDPYVFGVKMHVNLTVNDSNELFRIGNSVLMRLTYGKLEVMVKGTGVDETKRYISRSRIGKDNTSCFVGFTFDEGDLRLYKDSIELAVTKLQEADMTGVNNTEDSMVVGRDARIFIRDISVFSDQREHEFMEAELQLPPSESIYTWHC